MQPFDTSGLAHDKRKRSIDCECKLPRDSLVGAAIWHRHFTYEIRWFCIRRWCSTFLSWRRWVSNNTGNMDSRTRSKVNFYHIPSYGCLFHSKIFFILAVSWCTKAVRWCHKLVRYGDLNWHVRNGPAASLCGAIRCVFVTSQLAAIWESTKIRNYVWYAYRSDLI